MGWGIETDRGLLVEALVAAGYQVIAVSPLAAGRYRERHTISRSALRAFYPAALTAFGSDLGGRDAVAVPQLVLAARALAEFGDDPDRYASARARKDDAGTAPITRASGLPQLGLARAVGNRRLSTACHLMDVRRRDRLSRCPPLLRRPPGSWRHPSSGAPGPGERLVWILHGCLRHRQPYDKQLAWPASTAATAA